MQIRFNHEDNSFITGDFTNICLYNRKTCDFAGLLSSMSGNDLVSSILFTKFTKTFGAVGLAVATGGASLAAQKLYDDNKIQLEKTNKLCLYGAWHFAENQLEEFVGGVKSAKEPNFSILLRMISF